ncbi:hypothetical protein BDZ89DRAFT_1070280 [Hymenopellis radicata]|nr:hypothetical protein BDZ89DRAFT_1070280 [Hymenopellis radicata]
MSDAFNSAAAYLSSPSPSSPSPSTQTKLELYALYKYVTSGPKPTTTRPGLLDWTGRAKWDAWDKLGGKDMDETEAQERYMEIAKGMGWPGPSSDIPLLKKEEEDIDWDNLDNSEPSTSTSKGAGFGVSVSTMRRTDDADAPDTEDGDGDGDVNAIDEYGYTPLHRAADRGDDVAVKRLLERGAKIDVKDQDGMTPLDVAIELGHEEVIQLLNPQ